MNNKILDEEENLNNLSTKNIQEHHILNQKVIIIIIILIIF